MQYEIYPVDGIAHRHAIEYLNSLCPETFPALTVRHLQDGFWWLVYLGDDPVGFAGMVPFVPFDGVWYLKRCYLKPSARGHNLQYRLMVARIAKAKNIGCKMLVSECLESNSFSARNFARAGFERCEPEQKWGAPDSIYWAKVL